MTERPPHIWTRINPDAEWHEADATVKGWEADMQGRRDMVAGWMRDLGLTPND